VTSTGTTALNPEVYERIEVAVDDVVPVARALAATDDAFHQSESTACAH
jgi:hypothetical protein